MAFPTTGPVLDDFNRSDRSLNGDEMSSAVDSWAATARIDSGDLDGEITTSKFARATSGTISARGQRSYDRLAAGDGRGVEAWAKITNANATPGTSCQLWWAISDPNTATPDGYLLRFRSDVSELTVVRVDDGAETQLGATITGQFLFGDQIGIWHEDDGPGTIHVYKNEGTGWEELTTRTDTTYDAGFLGLALTQTSGVIQFSFDDFGGGEAAPVLVTVSDPIVVTEVVHFDKSTAAAPTTQTVVSVVRPNGMWLMGTRQTAYGDAVEANHFLGFAASPTEQWGIWAGRENGVIATASHAQKAAAAHILELYDIAAHDSPDTINEPIVLSRADLGAFLSNGFRLSYPDDNNAEAAKCHAFLFRGIREVAVIRENFNLLSGAVGDERDWAAGFPPDVVQFLTMGMFDVTRFEGERFGVAEPTIGAARNAADRWSSAMTLDWHTFEEEDNIQVENRCVAVPADNETGGYQWRFELDYVGPLANGFRTRVVRQDPAPSGSPPAGPGNYNWRIAALALGGLNVELVRFKVRTSLGFQKIPASFTPVGAMFVSASRNKDYNVHNTQTLEALQSIGFADGVEQAAIWSQSKVLALSIDPTETNIKNRADRCIILAEEPTVKQQEARIVGWDTDGIWIEWMVVGADVVSGDDWEVLVLVLGDATPAPGGAIVTGTQIVRQPDQVVAY